MAEREVKKAASEAAKPEGPRGPLGLLLGVLGACASLWVFLCGLQILGESFKAMGGKGAGSIFSGLDNPLAGLMVGVLATVLVQSSSTSTSIVVGLVGARQMSVQHAIPVIMGANIGTSVTNTIVSMGFAGSRVDLQRAFAAATVHDCFNLLSVATLLPVEIVSQAVQGTGGLIFWITEEITRAIMGGSAASDPLESPIKVITKPIQEIFIANNKYVIYALSLGAPQPLPAERVNATACEPLAAESRRLEAGRSLLSRRLTELVDCSNAYCVSSDLDKNLKKIAGVDHASLIECDGYISQPADPCAHEKDHCYINAGDFYQKYVQEHDVIKGGLVEPLGDTWGGVVALAVALLLLIAGLTMLTKVLHWLFSGNAKRCIVAATKMNNYVAMLVGVLMTIVAQSSSVVTSALTPFAALGLITLEKMLPLTLGANIGTTCTALLAAATVFKADAVHIALAHLFFNILGILIWYPVPFMRFFVLFGAKTLGLYASEFRYTPIIYVVVVFLLLPGVALGVSIVWDRSVPAGAAIGVAVLLALGAFTFWWSKLGGCYKVLSEERRVEIDKELTCADRELRGEDCEEPCVVADGEEESGDDDDDDDEDETTEEQGGNIC